MRFRIPRVQKAALSAGIFLCLVSQVPLRAQHTFCETYLRSGLPAGADDAERRDGEPVVQLFDRSVSEFRFLGGTLKEYEVVHRRFKIFDESALTEFSELYVPLAGVEEVVFIKARAVSPSGEKTETDLTKIKSVEENGLPYKLLVVEGVQVNGTVEIIYCVRKAPEIYRNHYLGGSCRVLESEYWLLAPSELILDHHVFNTDRFTRTDSTMEENMNGARLTVFSFPQIPPMVSLGRYFPNGPLKYRVESTLRRNTAKADGIGYGYDDIAALSYEVISKTVSAGRKEIKKIAAKIDLSDKPTEREKVIGIESYIKSTYKKADADDPRIHTIKYLYTRASGSGDAIISLYAGLFDHFGISYELGFTCNRTLKFIEPEFENWANLEQWTIRFPDTDLYILPLDPVSAPGYMNNDYRGNRFIRIIAPKTGTVASSDLLSIPEGPPAGQKETVKISLDREMNASAKYEYAISGNTAAGMRWLRDLTFEEPGFLMAVVQNMVETRYPDQKPRNTTFRFSNRYGDPDYTATLLFASTPPELVEKAGDHYIFYPGRYYQSNFFLAAEFPKDYAYPVQATENTLMEFEMEIPVPDGYRAELPEKPSTAANPDFGDGRRLDLEVTLRLDGDKVKLNIREDQRLGKIAPADLPRLTAFIEALRRIEDLYFVITKP